MEGRVAFAALLRHFPGMKLDMLESDFKWRPSPVLRGLEKLVVSA
jgi:cytochrome P450